MTHAGEPGVLTGLREIYDRMSIERRRQFYLVLALMLASVFAELATLGSVLPFLSLLSDPAGLGQLPWPANAFADLPRGRDSLIAAALLFTMFVIIAGLVRLQLAWAIQDFSYRLGHELLVDIERHILLQPYSFHIERNTSTLLSAIEKVEVLVFDVLLPAMQGLVAAFLAAAIVAALIYIDPFTTLIAAASFSIVYVVVAAVARKRLALNSQVIGVAFNERLKIAQESLGGIRDVIIDHSHALYLAAFERVNDKLRAARSNTAFIGAAPRFIVETLGMVIIAGIAVVIARREGGLAEWLPILGAIALGAQRLLPLLQQVYTGWSTASGQQSILGQIVDLLHLPAVDEQPAAKPVSKLGLTERIRIEKVSFTYPTRRTPAVDDVTLDIPRGSSLALVGETGSGKSTLADLLMGLIEPDRGKICIDGVALTKTNRRRWQRSIAHVPQSIFLVDATIARNIALSAGDEAIDLDRVIEASKTAQLHDFVTSLADGYDTFVGERGIRLSGGQRQRLGIARAIYKQAPVLVLDEATSAVDESTEARIIEALHELAKEGRTLIIIAHRPSTIALCDRLARLHNGGLVEPSSPVGGKTGSRRRA